MTQRKEGKQLKITDMMMKSDRKSLDNFIVKERETPSDRNGKLDDDNPEGNTLNSGSNLVCVGGVEPGPV